MKKILTIIFSVFAALFLFNLVFEDGGVNAAKPSKPAAGSKQASCKSCHADFASILPKTHPAVKGSDLGSCLSCHKPDFSGNAKKNAYAARMHLAHLGQKANLECTACHAWAPGRSFSLIGVKGSWGKPTKDDMKLMKEEFASWAQSGFMDNLHARGAVNCMGCHGKDMAKADSTVENARCLECHGPMDKLAAKSAPKDFADRNPHKSHLGEIACTVCHKGHQASAVYCLDCHQKFKMTIPGAKK